MVGLLEFDGYYANDISEYEAQNGLPSVTLENVLVDGFGEVPGINNSGRWLWTSRWRFPWRRDYPR